MDFLYSLVARNYSEVFLCFTPLDAVANIPTGLEALGGLQRAQGRGESKTLRSEAQPGGK